MSSRCFGGEFTFSTVYQTAAHSPGTVTSLNLSCHIACHATAHTKKRTATTNPNNGVVTVTNVSAVLCSTVLFHLISANRTGHTRQGHPRSCGASGAGFPITGLGPSVEVDWHAKFNTREVCAVQKKDTSSMLVKFTSSFETSSSSSRCLSTKTATFLSTTRNVTEQST